MMNIMSYFILLISILFLLTMICILFHMNQLLIEKKYLHLNVDLILSSPHESHFQDFFYNCSNFLNFWCSISYYYTCYYYYIKYKYYMYVYNYGMYLFLLILIFGLFHEWYNKMFNWL